MNISEITNRIKKIRIEKCGARHGSQKDFANFLGLKYTTYVNYEKDRVQPEFLILLREKLGVSIDWLLTGEGGTYEKELNASKEAAKATCVAEDDMPWVSLAMQNFTRQEGPEELASVNVFPLQLAMTPNDKSLQRPIESMILPVRLTRQAPIGLKVGNNEMAPIITSGSIIGLDYRAKAIEEGKIFVVRAPGKGAVVRRLFTGLNETIILRADDSLYPDIVLPKAETEKNCLMAGRVRWVVQSSI